MKRTKLTELRPPLPGEDVAAWLARFLTDANEAYRELAVELAKLEKTRTTDEH